MDTGAQNLGSSHRRGRAPSGGRPAADATEVAILQTPAGEKAECLVRRSAENGRTAVPAVPVTPACTGMTLGGAQDMARDTVPVRSVCAMACNLTAPGLVRPTPSCLLHGAWLSEAVVAQGQPP